MSIELGQYLGGLRVDEERAVMKLAAPVEFGKDDGEQRKAAAAVQSADDAYSMFNLPSNTAMRNGERVSTETSALHSARRAIEIAAEAHGGLHPPGVEEENASRFGLVLVTGAQFQDNPGLQAWAEQHGSDQTRTAQVRDVLQQAVSEKMAKEPARADQAAGADVRTAKRKRERSDASRRMRGNTQPAASTSSPEPHKSHSRGSEIHPDMAAAWNVSIALGEVSEAQSKKVLAIWIFTEPERMPAVLARIAQMLGIKDGSSGRFLHRDVLENGLTARLTDDHIRRLATEFGTAVRVVVQRHGTAVYVPVGWLHMVINVAGNAKYAREVKRSSELPATALLRRQMRMWCDAWDVKGVSMPPDEYLTISEHVRELVTKITHVADYLESVFGEV